MHIFQNIDVICGICLSQTKLHCFIIKAPLVFLFNINRKNWLVFERLFRWTENSPLTTDNCRTLPLPIVTAHIVSISCNIPTITTTLTKPSVAIVGGHFVGPVYQVNDTQSVPLQTTQMYLYILTCTVSGYGFTSGSDSVTGAGWARCSRFCNELANRKYVVRNWVLTLNEGHSCALIKTKQGSRIIEYSSIEHCCHRY